MKSMEQPRRQQLAEILARRYRQPERLVLLSRLGVDPEECTLGAQAPEEVAWRIVRWFEDRGRVEELDRAARVGWSRRLLRRLSLASVAMSLLGLVLMFGVNLFGMQGRLCRLSLGQPALADACGAWQLGGTPTRAERVAWESRDRESCAALRTHLARFSEGAYAKIAHARIASLHVVVTETWKTRENPLKLFVGRDVPPARDRAAAVAQAQKRALAEANEQCTVPAKINQNRLRSVHIDKPRPSCDPVKGGVVCSMEFVALCEIDERGQHEQETCPESGTP